MPDDVPVELLARDSMLSSWLEFLRHAEAEVRINVLAIEWDLREARPRVQGDRLRLTRAGFEHDALHAQTSSLCFELGENQATEATTARTTRDVHSFDFCDTCFQASHGSAPGWHAINRGDEKPTPPGAYFLGV
ncbi:MAG TPA: hypothetical protein VHU84_19305 [Lacipirellulaceae bacterium]|nr:hypothetical protein [Lacipirellulaceae bacterium]